MSAPIQKEIFTSKELSELIGVPTKTLARWRSQRSERLVGPAYFRLNASPTGPVRYHRSDIAAWINSQKAREQ